VLFVFVESYNAIAKKLSEKLIANRHWLACSYNMG
jgi:hypothetical protein